MEDLAAVAAEGEPATPLPFPLTKSGSSVQMNPQETLDALVRELSIATAVARPVSPRPPTSPWAMSATPPATVQMAC